MEQIQNIINESMNHKLIYMIISNPRKTMEMNKIRVRPVQIKKQLMFQMELYIGKQVKHMNYSVEGAVEAVTAFAQDYKQIEIKTGEYVQTVMISKKGKLSVRKRKEKAEIPARQEHNRQKKYILQEGQVIPFLQDLGIMTNDCHIVHAKFDKYKQMNRYLEWIEDVLPHLPTDRCIRIIDFGCGKSYLTFAVYYYFTVIKGYQVQIVGLDLKESVMADCNRLAKKYGYSHLKFEVGTIESYQTNEMTDMVISLHACDTATDEAIAKGIQMKAKVIMAVPCCHHEMNQQLGKDKLKPIFHHGLIKERMSALMTDALRAELMETVGYKVQLLEFIEVEHTPKNVLIRAVYTGNCKSKEEYKACKTMLEVEPMLEVLLKAEWRKK